MDATRSVKVSFYLKNRKTGEIKKFTDPKDPSWMVRSRRFDDVASSCRWILYLFDTVAHQEEFILEQPERFKEADISTPKQAFYDHWCRAMWSPIHTWY